MKASDLYVEEYGEKAYMDWKLREENFRRMKEAGVRPVVPEPSAVWRVPDAA